MSDPQRDDTLASISAEIVAFRDARDWAQFHTPRNLAAALAIEAAEIQETLLWKTDKEVAAFVSSQQGGQSVGEELADVMIYYLLLAHALGIEPAEAVRRKLALNAKKYPVEIARSNATKYTDL